MTADPQTFGRGDRRFADDGPVRDRDRDATGGAGSDASVSDLLSRLSGDATLLFRQEVELAKAELRREAKAAGKAGGMLGAAGLLGFVALLLLAWAASWGLAEVLPTWLAFLIVGVVFGAVAAALFAAGKKRMQDVDFTPYATIETLQDDKQMLSERMTR